MEEAKRERSLGFRYRFSITRTVHICIPSGVHLSHHLLSLSLSLPLSLSVARTREARDLRSPLPLVALQLFSGCTFHPPFFSSCSQLRFCSELQSKYSNIHRGMAVQLPDKRIELLLLDGDRSESNEKARQRTV